MVFAVFFRSKFSISCRLSLRSPRGPTRYVANIPLLLQCRMVFIWTFRRSAAWAVVSRESGVFPGGFFLTGLSLMVLSLVTICLTRSRVRFTLRPISAYVKPAFRKILTCWCLELFTTKIKKNSFKKELFWAAIKLLVLTIRLRKCSYTEQGKLSADPEIILYQSYHNGLLWVSSPCIDIVGRFFHSSTFSIPSYCCFSAIFKVASFPISSR